MAFEVERLKEGIKYKYGSKGKWETIDQAKTDKMLANSMGLLYRVRIPGVLDVYAGLWALRLDPKLMKLKVVNGMVIEQVYEPTEVELPPEEDAEAEG